MTPERSWVVLGDPGKDPTPDDQFAAIFGNPDDAVAYRDRVGGPAAVFVLTPMPETAYYDWGVRHTVTGPGVVEYVGELAARSCRRDGDVLFRRRRGSKAWTAVTP